MIDRTIRLVLPFALCFALFSCRVDQPSVRPADEAFTWFSSLGFPDVRDSDYVSVRPAQPFNYGLEFTRNRSSLPGFLLRDDEQTFTVLTLDLYELTFEHAGQGGQANPEAEYERLSFSDAVAAYIERLRSAESRPLGRRLSRRAERFVLAWACWRQGLAGQAVELYDEMVAMRPVMVAPQDYDHEQYLQDDLAESMMWRTVEAFADVSISRADLAEQFADIARRFPMSKYAADAQETARRLAAMATEDESHVALPGEQVTRQQRIAELIFRLRDQHGQQFSQPGAPSIFNGPADQAGAADHLVDIGFDAVPQLIAALDDKSYTRTVGFWRDFTFSHYVIRVGDCAKTILEIIAARSFDPPNERRGPWERNPAFRSAVREEAHIWWADIQTNGEEQVLLETVAAGGRDSPTQGARLLERYPDRALDALVEGIGQTEDPRVRRELTIHVANVPGDEPIPFLLAELNDASILSIRVIAAFGLRLRGRPEAFSAMIEAWQQLSEEDDAEDLICFLATSNQVEGIKALAGGLRERPIDMRLEVIDAVAKTQDRANFFALGDIGRDIVPEDQVPPPSPAVSAAIEELLIGCLYDTDERVGMSTSWDEVHYEDPRVCDLAGHALEECWPDKYSFPFVPSLPQRERQRVGCINVWRQANGLAEIELPGRQAISTPPR